MVLSSENLVPLFSRNNKKLSKGNSLKILWWVQIVEKYKWKSIAYQENMKVECVVRLSCFICTSFIQQSSW